LADILSRNPAGLEVKEFQNLSKPSTISVNKTDLQTEQAVLKNLKNLADKGMTQDYKSSGINKLVPFLLRSFPEYYDSNAKCTFITSYYQEIAKQRILKY
jgi:hypothetical protein